MEINELRGGGIIAVIFIHTTALALDTLHPGSPLFYAFFFVNRAAQFAVPLFIFMSGLSLIYAYAGRAVPYLNFLKRRVTSVVIPYLSWSLIYFLWVKRSGWLSSANPASFAADLALFLRGALLGTTYYHLYFVMIILQFYLLFPSLRKWMQRPGLLPTLLSLAAFQIAYVFFSQRHYFRFNDRFFLSYLIFFVLGMLAGQDLGGFRRFLVQYSRKVKLAFGLGLVTFLTLSYFSQVLGLRIPGFWLSLTWIGYSLLTTVFLAQQILPGRGLKRARLGQLLDSLGRYSFPIYLIHPLILSLSAPLLTLIRATSVSLSFVFSVLLSLGAPTLLTHILRQFPVGRFFTGRVE